jgi:hypothetical protein
MQVATGIFETQALIRNQPGGIQFLGKNRTGVERPNQQQPLFARR